MCAISWAPSVRLCERCIHSAPLRASQFESQSEYWSLRRRRRRTTTVHAGFFALKTGERGSVFVPCRVYEHACVPLCVRDRGCAPGALIQLAFKTLINCRGICLFSVNAISHAECSVNGCLPTAGPAPTSSPLLLSSPPLLSSVW